MSIPEGSGVAAQAQFLKGYAMLNQVRDFVSVKGDRRGIAAIEYALIASFMAVALVVSVPFLTAAISTGFTSIATHISTGK